MYQLHWHAHNELNKGYQKLRDRQPLCAHLSASQQLGHFQHTNHMEEEHMAYKLKLKLNVVFQST